MMVSLLLHINISAESNWNQNLSINIFAYKIFDKKDKFPFFIVRMPYLPSNIPSPIFYGSISSEFVSKTSQLYARMITQGRKKASILHQIKKVFQRYPETFSSVVRHMTN